MSSAYPHAAPAGPRGAEEDAAPGAASQVAGLAKLAALAQPAGPEIPLPVPAGGVARSARPRRARPQSAERRAPELAERRAPELAERRAPGAAVSRSLPKPGWNVPDRPMAPGTTVDIGPAALQKEISRLSRGRVQEILPSGPVLAAIPGQRRRLRRSTFAPGLRTGDRLIVGILTLGWAVCLVAFWVWWVEPTHRLGDVGLALNSVVLLYVSCFPAFLVLGANRLRKISPAVSVPLLRVAFVVTRAPSEPWQVASSTLDAMLGQDFPIPYDVWICDEQPTAEGLRWCTAHGVKISTRNGVEAYHRDTWPRRTRCKEGNLAYFYDNWGYRHYEVVVQLDCDHVPAPTYLAEMVRPFADPAVGYVAAPSVCDANAADSWSARGRLHREAIFHGPFQLGLSDGLGPLCIGSHYAVRTQALRDIGGIGPDLAEDFSTSFLLNSAGWHGVFAIDAEAHGDGPNTFSAMLTQEFQWSRSLTTLLLGMAPRHLKRLPWRLRLRFSYAVSFYVLLTATTIAGFALAPVAAVTGRPWVNVNYLDFLLRWWSVSIWLFLIALLLRWRGLLRPLKSPILSWENSLYCLTRWPFNAMGMCAAMLQRIRPRQVTFKVTPKSANGLEPLPIRVMLPYVVISIASASAALVGERYTSAVGYVFLSLIGGAMYAMVTILVPLLHVREISLKSRLPIRVLLWRTVRAPLAMAPFAWVPVAVAVAYYPAYAVKIFLW
jgi:cellulose synthase/poly-beta-1,6-N-acetylglucosamine synthase-like glycosyltransferase